jgi:predicted GNAT family acetyltransferase
MSNDVRHNPDEQRYEISVDGTLAGFVQAIEDGDVVTLPHTEVFDEFEGQGLASELVGQALDDLRSRSKKVVVTCPYVSSFIKKHDDYADLLA